MRKSMFEIDLPDENLARTTQSLLLNYSRRIGRCANRPLDVNQPSRPRHQPPLNRLDQVVTPRCQRRLTKHGRAFTKVNDIPHDRPAHCMIRVTVTQFLQRPGQFVTQRPIRLEEITERPPPIMLRIRVIARK
jgi:hypothetical protein